MTVEQHPSHVALLAFAAGTLDEVQRVAIDDHVRGCARCRPFVGAMEHVGGIIIEGLPPTSLADGSLAKVMARLEHPAAPSVAATAADSSDHAIIPVSRHEERRHWFGRIFPSMRRSTQMANAARIGDFRVSSGVGHRRLFGHWTAPGQRLRTGVARAALIIFSLGITYLAVEYAFFRYEDDYPASTGTTGKVAIGGSTTGNIERPGDADWFKVTLTSGKTYRFLLEGSDTDQGTLRYPVLRLLDNTGNELHRDAGSIDGPGPGRTSVVTHTAPSTGTYHVSCEASGQHIGTYKISAIEL
ncbi:MAG: zf-HC2 domain-containing protein [Rhodoplanes sp.]